MEELKEFLLSHTYIKVVYLMENGWAIHRPSEKHEVKTREEILNPVVKKQEVIEVPIEKKVEVKTKKTK
jgi:hypothetical protein